MKIDVGAPAIHRPAWNLSALRFSDDLIAVARLDLAEVLRSRWMVFYSGVYALLAAVFVLVGMRESVILGFTGMGRVLLSFCHALVLLLPLLALTAVGQVVNHARDDGTLELLFSHPISRGGYFQAVSAVRYGVLLVPLAGLMVGMAGFGRLVLGQAVSWAFVGRSLLICAALLWAFVGLGMAISTLVRNPARAMMYLLLLWAVSVALLDFGLIGLMLQWHVNPSTVFLLATLNPVQAARMALLATAEPELSILGPVGFFLANRVGVDALFALGVAWPAAVGLGAWTLAWSRFRQGDLV